MVFVIKKDRATLNKFILDDNYTVPSVDDGTHAKMSGGKYFCTLDLIQAYLHMEADDEIAMLQAISTQTGVYKVKRLMLGLKVAPNKWQRYMDKVR